MRSSISLILGRLALMLVFVAGGALPVRAEEDELTRLYPPVYVEVLRKAIQAFNDRDFAAAEKFLFKADGMFPDTIYALNMRGAIAIEQKRLEDGERFCKEALKKEAKFFPARFNLAEIPFVQKNYAEARKKFEELLAEDHDNELLLYRIFLTYLLEGNDEEAKKALEAIKFPSNTAAYYYGNAAWEFYHGDEEKARGWVKSGNWVFPPSRNTAFADVLYDLGWLKRPEKPAPQSE